MINIFKKFNIKTTLIKQVEKHEERILGKYLEQLTVSSVGIMVNRIATKLYQKLMGKKEEENVPLTRIRITTKQSENR